jgi:nucleotide-binding universal stress UspA family protein
MSIASSAPLLLSPHSLVDPPHPEREAGSDSPTRVACFREILACVDGSEFGFGVMSHARVVARALGARLTLLRVLESEDGDDIPPDPLDWGIRRREARAHLESLVEQLGELESGIRSELIQGRAAEQICNWVAHHDVDLTVLCSHGVHGVTDWDLASTARKLIDRMPGSLFLVPAAAASAAKEVRYRRILVPLDGSPRAESVVPVALRIAALEAAELLFVHVVPEPEITRVGPLDAEGVELERRVAEHNYRVAIAYLDRLRARVGRDGVRVRSLVVRDGSVRTRLDRLIREERVDLVVMSAHGHAGQTDSPCGSVTEHAVTHATTPLLIVRERSHRARRAGPILERLAPPGLASP